MSSSSRTCTDFGSSFGCRQRIPYVHLRAFEGIWGGSYERKQNLKEDRFSKYFQFSVWWADRKGRLTTIHPALENLICLRRDCGFSVARAFAGMFLYGLGAGICCFFTCLDPFTILQKCHKNPKVWIWVKYSAWQPSRFEWHLMR